MASLSYPDRTYLLSDTFGGQEFWNPIRSPDIDAEVVTDVRSRLPVSPRKFDTFGAKNISDHVLRTVVALHDNHRDAGTTGVFINSAPRTEKGSNGKPFYVAETDNGVRVVATPLEALSTIKPRITRLHHLPNENNDLYSSREQFRSSFTVALLADDHGLRLEEDDVNDIPDYQADLHVAYVDRFGNMVLHEKVLDGEPRTVEMISSNVGNRVRVAIGAQVFDVTVGISLAEAKPGELGIYGNDGNIDLVGKWAPNWTAQQILERSSYGQFGMPKIGDRVRVERSG